MDIVARKSGGRNIVGRPQARRNWDRPATAPAARAEVWKRNTDQPAGAAVRVGVFELGRDYLIDYNPGSDRDVLLGVNPLAADGTPCFIRPEDFVWAGVPVARATGTAAGLDEHVPTVTVAPTIAKAENADQWIVFTPAPDDNGATLTGCDIHVEKASDPAVFDLWQMLPVGSSHRIDQKADASLVKYRWRNQSAEDAGDGRGVSAWSPQANAAEIGAGVPDPAPSAVLLTFDPDPHDARAGIETDVLH